MKLSVVVPVFNEAQTLQYSFDRIGAALGGLSSRYEAIELILVNDGSRDQTASIMRLLSSPHFETRTLHFSRNFGHSAAVFAGLEASTGDHVAIMDADLQDPPEILGAMLDGLTNGADVVYGQRQERLEESRFKKMTAWLFYRVLDRLAGTSIPKDAGDFRVMTREVVDAVLSCAEADPFLRGLVAWVGFEQRPFLYTRDGRKFGETKYPFSKMFSFALTAIVNFSEVPLRAAFYFGAAGLFLMAVISAWALYVHMAGNTISGWTSLLIGFLLGQSITLIVVGIASHYVGRTFKQVQGRPRYIVRKTAPRG
jgi:glycosyltransferase involved in cell wall biosynthesis